jgi:hypothetical protein
VQIDTCHHFSSHLIQTYPSSNSTSVHEYKGKYLDRRQQDTSPSLPAKGKYIDVRYLITDQILLLHDSTTEASTSLYDVQIEDNHHFSSHLTYVHLSPTFSIYRQSISCEYNETLLFNNQPQTNTSMSIILNTDQILLLHDSTSEASTRLYIVQIEDNHHYSYD